MMEERNTLSVVAPKETLHDLERHAVSAALFDTGNLEYVVAHYSNRIGGQTGSLLKAAQAYFTIARGTLSRSALEKILAQNVPDIDKHAEYLALFDALTGAPYNTLTQEDRRWKLHEYDQEWQKQETGNILALAAESMREGHEVNGQKLVGAGAAWSVIHEGFLRLESAKSGAVASESEITSTANRAKQEYARAAQSTYRGVPMALPELNDIYGGLKPGAMHIVAGYANEGKSFILVNNALKSFTAGHNVVFASGEMTDVEMRARFYALHSCDPKFPHPIESRHIEYGVLSKEDHEIFLNVLEDLQSTPTYGKLYTYQFPFRSTPQTIFNKVSVYNQVVPIDALYIDYLGLMASDTRRVSRREELDDLVREVKARTLSFDQGRSISLEAAYQVNRQSYERALAEGHYTLTCFAESSEVEKSADMATWLLALPQNPDQLKMGVIKHRGGSKGEEFFVEHNFKHAQIRSMKSKRSQSKSTPSPADLLL